MARAGRKSKYETHIKPHLNWIEQMCQTMTEEQIAKSLGVSVSTWCDYKNKHPELAETLKRGRQCLVADLRSALIRKAKGYEYTESKVTSEEVTWPKEMYDALLEYLIRTYTRPGETVLDNCMGSGSTGVACVHTGRRLWGWSGMSSILPLRSGGLRRLAGSWRHKFQKGGEPG